MQIIIISFFIFRDPRKKKSRLVRDYIERQIKRASYDLKKAL